MRTERVECDWCEEIIATERPFVGESYIRNGSDLIDITAHGEEPPLVLPFRMTSERGGHRIEGTRGDGPYAHVVDVYTDHHATCPNAEDFRERVT